MREQRERPGTRGIRAAFVVAMLVSLGAFLLSLHFFVQPLRPWPDQGWMLQSAIRDARGLGLTTQMGAKVDDLTHPEFVRLTYFPPFYPLAVSALLRTRLGIGVAVKLVNLLAMLAGVLGWTLLAVRVLERSSTRWLFALLLVVGGSAVVPKGGTADYLYWAGMGWWVFAIVETRRTLDRGEIRRAVLGISAASIVVAMMIGVRWAAVVLVPTGMLAIAIPPTPWQPDRRRILAALGYSVPGVATFLGITMANRVLAGAGSSLQSMPPGWHFDLLATTYPFQSLFAIPLGIQPVLDRVWRTVDGSMSSVPLDLLFRVAVPFAAIVLIVVALRRRSRESGQNEAKGFLVVAAETLFVWVAFLGFMTVRYNWDFVDWSYLGEPRYFRPIWPLVGLAWLALIERFDRAWRTLAFVAISVCALYSLQAMIRWEHQWLTEPDESWELVEKVLSLEKRPGLQVIVDHDVSDYVIRASDNLVAFGYPDPGSVEDLDVSRSAELWMVRRVNEKTAYVLDPDFDVKRFEAMRARFKPEREWMSSGGNYELWHARIGE